MNLILCCDYGLDDAAATVDALSHAAADGYECAALVAAGGNVPPEISLANAKKLVAHLPFETVPLVVVDTTAEEQPAEYLKNIHGDDGMGDLFSDDDGFSAPVAAFSDWLAQIEGEYDLLSLGPMTLVPRILARGAVRKFVFMGGNIAETPNFHGYEFNHALDRAAFAAVDLSGGGLQRRIVARAREMTFVSGEKGCYIWDDMAVKALRHPDWFALYEAEDRDGNRLTVAKYTHGKPYLEILEE